jgi:hypothetical protein
MTLQSWLRAGLCASLLVLPALALSAERATKNLRKANPDDRTVELFEAIQAREIEVKLIPKDDAEARVLVKNNTKKPLNVKLPDAFAGVPVLAQVGGGNIGGGGGGGGANQSFGGGMGGMMGGGGMGMGMMNVAPEQVAQFKVDIVCLEHGKKDPRPNIPYKIAAVDRVTTRPGVKELLAAMGKGEIHRRAAQAAAWHLANGLSWEQLAAKRIPHLNGTSEPWFSPQEIQAGMRIATAAAAESQQTPPASPGERTSPGETLEQLGGSR